MKIHLRTVGMFGAAGLLVASLSAAGCARKEDHAKGSAKQIETEPPAPIVQDRDVVPREPVPHQAVPTDPAPNQAIPNNDRDTDSDKIKDNVAWERERDEFVAETRAKLDEIDAKLEQLEADLKKGGDRVKAETREAAADLRKQRDEVNIQLNEASKATTDKWDRFKKDMRDGVGRVEQGYNNLLEKMKTNN